ncbi:hypothetical protein FNV43_RR01653 [Rhamnella rubrinervis]|uniref:DNA topoisomerase n=1 Tax=Rhamnella rubrinervis TaxID=2594499 RepID=A0A8K0MS83_9ROSA|nr:hypothetical protein FNV43_RR01653 [Rhamnella rubrinervis]
MSIAVKTQKWSVDFPAPYQEWLATDPLDLFQTPIRKAEANPKAHICRHLSQEAHGCGYLVLWLDCDCEGENICFEGNFKGFSGDRRVILSFDLFQKLERLLADGYHKWELGTDAGDHPPITPMRSATEDMLEHDAWRLYEYVCQHFIGSVSPDCKYVRYTFWLVTLNLLKVKRQQKVLQTYHKLSVIYNNKFIYVLCASFMLACANELLLQGHHVAVKGFTTVMPWLVVHEKNLPQFLKGGKIEIWKVDLFEGSTMPPDCLSENDLISLMEKNGIGMDASIPVHISNICERNFVQIENKNALFEAQFSPLADLGRNLSKYGKCLQYMKYISTQPSCLYCNTCEEVYYLPQKGLMASADKNANFSVLGWMKMLSTMLKTLFGLKKEGTLPIKYLGVPLISTRLTTRDCRSVLFSIQATVYWSSIFVLPKEVCKVIDQILGSFLWHGAVGISKAAKVAWDVVYPEREGVFLGLKRVHDRRKNQKMEIFTVGVAKMADYTVVPIARQVGYLYFYKSNLDELKTQIENLMHVRKRLQDSVDQALGNGEDWFMKVDKIGQAKQESKEDGAIFNFEVGVLKENEAKKIAGHSSTLILYSEIAVEPIDVSNSAAFLT